MPLTRRQEIVLAALSAEKNAGFAPVQVQKMFFLIDENLATRLGGKQFSFAPYDYGPFDSNVYRELEALREQGLVEITTVGPGPGGRRYSLTAAGQAAGESVLEGLEAPVCDYMEEASKWVRSLSFAQLVGSIYKAYPQMRENSIFVD